MYQKQKQKGITLIALIITVIVLIILAGVAISLTVGENGILAKAKQAKTDYNLAKAKEELELEIANIQMEIMSQEHREATLNDLYTRIDKSKYTIELSFDPIATVAEVEVMPTYSIVNKIGTNYQFTVDDKLIIRKVEEKEININFGKPTWTNGKASVDITSKVEGIIEYQLESKNGNWTVGNKVENIENDTEIFARVNTNNGYTQIESKIIKDIISPTSFTIEVTGIKYNALTVNLTTIPTDNETGLKDYTYVTELSEDNKIELTNITETTKKITGLTEKANYKVYVIAYDNAGNLRKSNVIEIETPEKNITPIATSEYGKSVNYTANGISNWKIFYVDNDTKLADGVTDNPYYGCTYIIISGYLPVGKLPSGTQLSTYQSYAFYFSNITKATYHNIIDTDVSIRERFKMSWNKNTTNYNIRQVSQFLDTNVWKSFAEGTIDSNGKKLEDGYAIGSPTLEMWVESWNDAGYTKLYCNKQDNNGYYIGTTSSPSTTSQNLTSSYLSKTGWTSNSLFFPYTAYSGTGGAHGYILASPSAGDGKYDPMQVFTGATNNYYSSLGAGSMDMSNTDKALRPIVCLPPDAKLTLNQTTGLYDITQ